MKIEAGTFNNEKEALMQEMIMSGLSQEIVSGLQEEDFLIWRKIPFIARKEFEEYQQNVLQSRVHGRIDFCAEVANKLTPRFLQEDFKNRKAA